MTELETIQYTRDFLDQLANGRNPADGSDIPAGDVVNQVRISRCLFYASTILGRLVERGGFEAFSRPAALPANRAPFALSAEEAATFPFSERPLRFAEMLSRINGLTDSSKMKRLKAQAVSKLLLDHGLVEIGEDQYGTCAKLPTEKGDALGIDARGFPKPEGGFYTGLVFGIEAQRFVVDHMAEVVENNAKQKQANAPALAS